MRRAVSTRPIAALATTVVLVLLGGCGDGGGGEEDGGAFAELSGEEISDAAKKDMLELESMRYEGSLTNNGSPFSLDVQASTEGACTGTLELNGGTVEVLASDGGNWYRPDEDFWRANAPDQAEEVIAAVGDKWVIDSGGDFVQFCDLEAFLTNIFEEDGKSTYETTGTEEIDGQEVVKVDSTDEDGTATGYVLVEGEHYLVKIEREAGDNPGELTFGDFDEEVTAQAPAEADQIDLSTLG